MTNQPPGPTLLGVDMIFVGTILAGVAALAVMFAVYAAITVRDPMTKRVKALNARREELKAGIQKSTAKKRQSLVRKTDQTEKVKDTLSGLKVLEQSQLETIQQKLAWAGYRNKELAVYVVFARMILPIVLGLIGLYLFYISDMFPDWGSFKRLGACLLYTSDAADE